MKQKTKEAWRTVALGLAVTIAGMSAVFDITMLRNLLSPWWIPVACVLAVTFALALPFRSVTCWLTGSARNWLNITCHVLMLSPILLLAVLTLNFVYTQGDDSCIPAVVERVYRENREHTRRVGRRSYSRYTSLHHVINVTMENGDSRKIDIPRKLYSKILKGDTVDIPVTTGIFRIVQLDESHIRLRHPHAARKHRSRSVMTPRSSADEVMQRHRQRIDSIRRKFRND